MQKRMKRGGFTLVELLVVIGIIAVLIAMLLPVLGKAQEAARATKCMSNLRQIGIANVLYANTYNDFVPAGVTSYTLAGEPGDWTGLITPLMNTTKMKSYDFAAMLRCPSNLLAATAATNPQAYSYATTTALSGNLMRRDLGPVPMKLAKIKNPTATIIVFETGVPTSTGGGGSTYDQVGNKIGFNWHTQAANYLMCDGSVQRIRDPFYSTQIATRSASVDGSKDTYDYWFRGTNSPSGFSSNPKYRRLWTAGSTFSATR